MNKEISWLKWDKEAVEVANGGMVGITVRAFLIRQRPQNFRLATHAAPRLQWPRNQP
ncbi:hypothetical protein ACVC7V_08740 [Hydrogenophaga sp. A37]|uniref:hypothetical protein n=1 Tax=Hydrogenophaga sp. A37 TaxID=1945864 RepID=UPI0015C52BBE|nr:hypothetical protein [Hydrogenophaga sp. A37]